MIIRALMRDDSLQLYAFWNHHATMDRLTLEVFEEKIWGDPDYKKELTLVAVENKEILGFIMGVVRPIAEGTRGHIKLILVDWQRRREGIGGQLLQAVEPLLQEKTNEIRVCESTPNYLTPGLDVRYTMGMLFFEKHGYERFGETYNLLADLEVDDFDTTAKEHAIAKEGIVISRARYCDHEAVDALLEAQWPPWKLEIGVCFKNTPISLHIATREDKVLAFSAYDTNNKGTGWFGPMGTDPVCRGLGIGGVLLRRCLRDLKAQGLSRSIIPWVGPIPFYAHYAGAEIDRVFYRFKKTFST